VACVQRTSSPAAGLGGDGSGLFGAGCVIGGGEKTGGWMGPSALMLSSTPGGCGGALSLGAVGPTTGMKGPANGLSGE